ncbi:MAG: fatty acid desaturase [Verrucomicrobiales bacterium]
MDTGVAHPMEGHPSPLQAPWKDLVRLSTAERVWELFLPLPWLVLSLALFQSHWFILGIAPVFYFFLTGLRLSHQAQHYSIGLSKFAHDMTLFVLSALMFASMHAVQVSHLHHHRRCLEEDDTEGAWAKYPWWQALALGPLFVVRLHITAFQRASREKRRWILFELGAIATILIGIACSGSTAWMLHASGMVFGECMTGFFAVWTVHHHCDHDDFARTQRGKWWNLVFYNMFLHKEHHLYPQVPTAHLGILAERLDNKAAHFAIRQVLPSSLRRAARNRMA